MFEIKKKSLFHATSLFSKVVGGSCLGVGSICFPITNMGLSSMIENREQIQRKVVQLVFHNVVKGGWKVALHNNSRQKNITGLMYKVGHLQDMVSHLLDTENGGPYDQTVTSFSPWIITVGAGVDDRSHPKMLTLGNIIVFPGTLLAHKLTPIQ
jgi:hypothetical protein